MSSTRLNSEFLAAEILATGKRQCWTCRMPRDATTGKVMRLANGTTQWRCGCCVAKIKPPSKVA